MNMALADVLGVASAIVVLAGVSIVVVNGGSVASILGAAGDAFSNSIKAATLR
jgi:hypothetical protein